MSVKKFSTSFKIASLLMVLFYLIVFADEIVLQNGQQAKVVVLDTSGCDVKISRNESTASIQKKLVKYIIWKMDTIHYDNFDCIETTPAITKQIDPCLDSTFLKLKRKYILNEEESRLYSSLLQDCLRNEGKTNSLKNSSPNQLTIPTNYDQNEINSTVLYRLGTYHQVMGYIEAGGGIILLIAGIVNMKLPDNIGVITAACGGIGIAFGIWQIRVGMDLQKFE